MGSGLDWRRAKSLKPETREPRNVGRLERAADNWLAGKSLTKQPKDVPPKKGKRWNSAGVCRP